MSITGSFEILILIALSATSYAEELCFGIANGRVLNFGALYT